MDFVALRTQARALANFFGRTLLMLTLYYAPGACSMASHIGLEESGAPYEVKPVALAKGEQKTEAYLKINPRAKAPALKLEDGSIITENTATLSNLGLRFPERRLRATDPGTQAHASSQRTWRPTH